MKRTLLMVVILFFGLSAVFAWGPAVPGIVGVAHAVDCWDCDGDGWVDCGWCGADGIKEGRQCGHCNGRGEIKCFKCGGSGTVTSN